jgi:hypothetical protein
MRLTTLYSETLQNDRVPFSHGLFFAGRTLATIIPAIQTNTAYLVYPLDCFYERLLV